MKPKFKDSDTAMYKANKQFGDYFELACIPFIEEKFNKVLNTQKKYLKYLCDNQGDTVIELKGWDLMFGIYNESGELLKKLTFEIKTDKTMIGDNPSPNCFFERTCSKKPSGVYVSTADFFVYSMPLYNEENFFIVKPNDLVNLFKANPQYRIVSGGEGNRVRGYLLTKDEFVEDFIGAGGKVWNWNITIPAEFGIQKEVIKYEFEEIENKLTYKEVKMRF
ncbi:MAG: hypothetical protein V4572_12125 [Bacteroidota bacterium]